LIVYGTRYGAAASTSEEIAKILRHEGVDTQVVDAKKQKIKDILPYQFVIVGSGIQINRWTSEPEDFLKRFKKELATKKLALFVCCGSAALTDSTKIEQAEKMKKKYLDEKAAQIGVQPIALGFFGGVYNYNNEPWWAKKALEADRPRVEATYKQSEPGVYDTRDWNVIRSWVKELSQKSFS
jgi:menaquinone-dependent protoporphyrinogen oxidase